MKGPFKMINEEAQEWYVYICISNAGHYYFGISPDPLKRLVKHNSNEGSKMARDQGVFKLVYVSKPFADKSTARKREIQLKGWTRKKKEKHISGDWE